MKTDSRRGKSSSSQCQNVEEKKIKGGKVEEFLVEEEKSEKI